MCVSCFFSKLYPHLYCHLIVDKSKRNIFIYCYNKFCSQIYKKKKYFLLFFLYFLWEFFFFVCIYDFRNCQVLCLSKFIKKEQKIYRIKWMKGIKTTFHCSGNTIIQFIQQLCCSNNFYVANINWNKNYSHTLCCCARTIKIWVL